MKFIALPALLLGAAPAFAKPGDNLFASLFSRAAADPAVLYPHNGTVWYGGEIHNVSWNTQDVTVPVCGSVMNTALYLTEVGSAAANGTGPLPSPISAGFSPSLGRMLIVAPNVTSQAVYQLIFKLDTTDSSDEGSKSGSFTIAPNSTTSA